MLGRNTLILLGETHKIDYNLHKELLREGNWMRGRGKGFHWLQRVLDQIHAEHLQLPLMRQQTGDNKPLISVHALPKALCGERRGDWPWHKPVLEEKVGLYNLLGRSCFFQVIYGCSVFESKCTLEVTAEHPFEPLCVLRESCQNILEY